MAVECPSNYFEIVINFMSGNLGALDFLLQYISFCAVSSMIIYEKYYINSVARSTDISRRPKISRKFYLKFVKQLYLKK